MEHGPESEDDELGGDVTPSRPEPAPQSTSGVRIIGAETAGDMTSEIPVVPPAHIIKDTPPHGSVRIIDERASSAPEEPAEDASHAELPHWTEPATGQVPAVLSRDDDGGPSDGILPPSWREEDADWTAHEEGFEPAMYSDERASLGALDETDATDEERRPWEFDLDSVKPGQPGPGAGSADPITEPVQMVRPQSNATGESSGESVGTPKVEAAHSGEATMAISTSEVAAAVAARGRSDIPSTETPSADTPASSASPLGTSEAPGVDLVDDSAVEDGARPTGTPRVGRARRSGLLPSRLKAKRPDDSDGSLAEPLTADLPGASVADVPGAGRRKTGLASMAAADRIAEQEHADQEEADPSTGSTVADADSAVQVDHEPRASRTRRRSGSDERPLRSSSNYTPDVTGGGPPPPARERRSRREPDRAAGSTGLRVGTGVAAAAVALIAFKLGTVTALILCLLVVTFAAGEFFAVLRKAGWRPATLLGLVGTISLMIGAYDKGAAAIPLILVLITAFTLLWYLFGVERGSAVAGTASTLLVIGWVALLGSFAGLLLSPSTFPNRHGIAFLLGAILATVANDVGALVVGRWVGDRQLAPNISPNKTWEGLAGGALASILVSTVIVGAIHPWSAANAALLGVVVAVVAPLGDLCESLLKRDLRLKDMGTILPGHGGVLDRVDALLFVLPATYYLVRALNIG